MIEFTDVGYADSITLSDDGRFIKFPVENSIVAYIIGELREIHFENIESNSYLQGQRYCTEITIYRIVGAEFTDGTVKKYSGVDL